MMSGSRQGLTGRDIKNFLIWGVGLCVFWWLPQFVMKLWPELSVSNTSPWLIHTSDLTWNRVVINLATKQGFRIVWMLLWTVGWMAIMWMPTSSKKRRRSTKFQRVSYQSSTEWVVDGAKKHTLGEYAVLVGAI